MARRFTDDRLHKSARGRPCAFNIPGACTYNPEQTVFCHAPSEGKGMGIKSPSYWGAFGCHGCHAVLDRRAKWNGDLISESDAAYFWLRGIYRTQGYWFESGLVCVTDGEDTKAGGSA